MELITANFHGKVRREQLNGREHIVVPITMMVSGVLNGSKGPLYYPPEEIAKDPGSWNHMPIVVYHPTDNMGKPISARDPDVLNKQGIGVVLRTQGDRKLRAEGWFDVEKTKSIRPEILTNLLARKPIELSTGLFTENEPRQGVHNGRSYMFIARNYRPDHLAILPDQVGACSINDGCGVLVNFNPNHGEDGKFSSGGGSGGGKGIGLEAFKKKYGREPATDSEMMEAHGGDGSPEPVKSVEPAKAGIGSKLKEGAKSAGVVAGALGGAAFGAKAGHMLGGSPGAALGAGAGFLLGGAGAKASLFHPEKTAKGLKNAVGLAGDVAGGVLGGVGAAASSAVGATAGAIIGGALGPAIGAYKGLKEGAAGGSYIGRRIGRVAGDNVVGRTASGILGGAGGVAGAAAGLGIGSAIGEVAGSAVGAYKGWKTGGAIGAHTGWSAGHLFLNHDLLTQAITTNDWTEWNLKHKGVKALKGAGKATGGFAAGYIGTSGGAAVGTSLGKAIGKGTGAALGAKLGKTGALLGGRVGEAIGGIAGMFAGGSAGATEASHLAKKYGGSTAARGAQVGSFASILGPGGRKYVYKAAKSGVKGAAASAGRKLAGTSTGKTLGKISRFGASGHGMHRKAIRSAVESMATKGARPGSATTRAGQFAEKISMRRGARFLHRRNRPSVNSAFQLTDNDWADWNLKHKGIKKAGKAVGGAAAGATGVVAGGAIGSTIGKYAGGALGSALGPAGTAVGATAGHFIGGALGAVAGGHLAGKAAKAVGGKTAEKGAHVGEAVAGVASLAHGLAKSGLAKGGNKMLGKSLRTLRRARAAKTTSTASAGVHYGPG